MESATGRQAGVVLLAGFLTGVSLAAAVCAPAKAEAAPPGDGAPADSAGLPSSDSTSPDGEEQQKADLGVQPVLLWDRVAKQVKPVSSSDSTVTLIGCSAVIDRFGGLPFQISLPRPMATVLRPVILTGIQHLPHGPPIQAR